jgi:DNA primase
MDVIALHSAGFTNAVATLGTAITAEQARMMSRYTKKVIISYDADEAGQKAADRAIKMLGEVGLDVTILKVPGAKDPDEYIKQFGADKFRQLLTETKGRFEYSMDNILLRYDLNIPQDKIKALHEAEKLISETYSSAERDLYIQSVAKKFGVDSKSVKSDVDRLVSRAVNKYKKETAAKIKQDAIGYSDRVNPDFIKAPAVAKNEETVVGLLLLYPEHRKKVFDQGLLSEEDFFTELNKRVFKYLLDAYRTKDDAHTDMDAYFTPEEIGRITKMKLSRMSLTDNGDGVLLDSIDSLKEAVRKKTSGQTNTYEELNRLLSKKREV